MNRTLFSYDEVGNRTDNGGTYGAGNRITAFGGWTYGTDADGNVTFRDSSGQRVDIAWDAANRPTRFTVNGVAIDMRYDAPNIAGLLRLSTKSGQPHVGHY